MPSIRITKFAGLLPQVNPKEIAEDHAQIAHNCLLWDGWLRPMPAWLQDSYVAGGIKSIYSSPMLSSTYATDSTLSSAQAAVSEPFSTALPIGLAFPGNPYINRGAFSNPQFIPVGLPVPQPSSIIFGVVSNNKSVYPISRTYAITFQFGNMEGPPYVFQQIGGSGTLFEGDDVAISFSLPSGQTGAYGFSLKVNLYRTVPGFDTAEQIGNPLETGFHLVGTYGASTSNYIYDSESSGSTIPGHLLISDQWMPPTVLAGIFYGITESGHGVVVGYNGLGTGAYVQISERYMLHAYPPQNTITINANPTSVAIFYDNIFVGTLDKPYVVRVGNIVNDVLETAVRYFPDDFACVSNTMTATNFGAMYIAKDGIIALTVEGDNVSSKRVASPGDLLYTATSSFHFYDATSSAWWNGEFFGFTNQGAFIFNQPTASTNEFPLGQLVTIDTPTGVKGPNLVTGRGLFAVWGNSVYTLPLPGYGYESSGKQTYTWKSKRFVMPGITTFAAMKVVNDGSGTLSVTVRGYNSGGATGPEFVYSRTLNHSKPFRIPHQHKCLEWEIVLSGTSTVQEVHLATSERDLAERPTRFDENQRIN
jgi:hypothetical protein